MKKNLTVLSLATLAFTASGCISTLGISRIDNPKLGGPNVASAVFAVNAGDNAMAVASISDQEISNGVTLCGQNEKVSTEFAESWNENLDGIANAHNELIAAIRESDSLTRSSHKLSFGPRAKALFEKTGISSQQMLSILARNEPVQTEEIQQIAEAYELETDVVTHYLKGLCLKIK
jgi:hypothetical protein